MCESNVYLKDEEGERLIVEDAVMIETEGPRIKIIDILGGQTEIDPEARLATTIFPFAVDGFPSRMAASVSFIFVFI